MPTYLRHAGMLSVIRTRLLTNDVDSLANSVEHHVNVNVMKGLWTRHVFRAKVGIYLEGRHTMQIEYREETCEDCGWTRERQWVATTRLNARGARTVWKSTNMVGMCGCYT